MPEVREFSRTMIREYLESRDMNYLMDRDGDFLVQFAYDEDNGCELSLYLLASGENEEIYAIRILSDKRIPKDDWGQAIIVCNQWNQERRWPKAYLYVAQPETDTHGTIHLEFQIDLETGIHQELLNDLTDTNFLAADLFWKWAHQEQGL